MMSKADNAPADPSGDGAPNSIRQICEAIWRIEKDLNLIERTVEGVHYWPIMRLAAYSGLTYKSKLYSSDPQILSRAAKLRLHFVMSAADLPQFIFGPSGSFDALYMHADVNQGRPGGFNLPIHGMGLEMDPAIRRLQVLYRPVPACPRFRCERHGATRMVLLDDLSTLFGRMRYRRYLAPMQTEWSLLNERMQSELGTDFPFDARDMAMRVSDFVERRRLYRAFFERLGSSRLFIQSAYCLPAIVAGAKDCGMDVCELQHGLITPYHLGYSYPGHPDVPYMANRLLLLGPYWQTAAELPGNIEPIVIGCHYLEPYKREGTKKVRHQAVVISQGAIGPRLFDAVANVAPRAPDWRFIFRPHPSELVSDYQAKLDNMDTRPANVTISVPPEDFSSLLASSEVQIGVFSTGLFEGMGFGTRTILLPLPGIEYMDDVVAHGEAVVASGAEDIPALLATAPKCRSPEKYYSAPVPSISALL